VAARGERAMNLTIGFVFDSGKNITPNWHTTASKLLSGNGRVAGGQIFLMLSR
jgi:hypothetical protein